MEREAIYDLPSENQKQEWEIGLAIAECDTELRQDRARPRFMKKALRVGLLASYLGTLSFASEALSFWKGTRDTIAPVIEGCNAPDVTNALDINWQPSEEITQVLQQIQVQTAGTQSLAHDFNLTPELNHNTNERILAVPWNFPERIAKFTLKQSGINIEVYSDKVSNLTIYPEQFETVFNESMQNWYIFSDDSMRDFFYCASESLLKNRERAGTTYKIFMPANPELCINGPFLVAAAEADDMTNCQKGGGTLPNFNYGLFERFIDPYWMLLTAGTVNLTEASHAVTHIASHEVIHALMSLMSTRPLLDPDEEFAHTASRQLDVVRQEQLLPIATYA